MWKGGLGVAYVEDPGGAVGGGGGWGGVGEGRGEGGNVVGARDEGDWRGEGEVVGNKGYGGVEGGRGDDGVAVRLFEEASVGGRGEAGGEEEEGVVEATDCEDGDDDVEAGGREEGDYGCFWLGGVLQRVLSALFVFCNLVGAPTAGSRPRLWYFAAAASANRSRSLAVYSTKSSMSVAGYATRTGFSGRAAWARMSPSMVW